MMKVKVFEDNGGGIHAVVMEDNEIQNIISGFEDNTLRKDDFIEAAKSGFEWADDYDADNYSGLSIDKVAEEMEEMDDLIAEITADSVELYAEKMGAAGHSLFGLEW